jgi:hypothetical protein
MRNSDDWISTELQFLSLSYVATRFLYFTAQDKLPIAQLYSPFVLLSQSRA